jgi:hypothetical protein
MMRMGYHMGDNKDWQQPMALSPHTSTVALPARAAAFTTDLGRAYRHTLVPDGVKSKYKIKIDGMPVDARLMILMEIQGEYALRTPPLVSTACQTW